MTANNILAACKAVKAKPVCASEKLHDGLCHPISGTEMAKPSSVKQNKKLDLKNIKGAYFYAGKENNGGLTLLNTGDRHVWSMPKRDRDGDTFCVYHKWLKGHGKCNCPSVNFLMKRVHDTKLLCAAKKKEEAKGKGNGKKEQPAVKVEEPAVNKEEPVKDRELGEEDDETSRAHMARIVREATHGQIKYAEELGQSLIETGESTSMSSLEHMMSDECAGVCKDVRGIVREIYETELSCHIVGIDMVANKEKIDLEEKEDEADFQDRLPVSIRDVDDNIKETPNGPTANSKAVNDN